MSLAEYSKTVSSIFSAVLDERLAPTALQSVAEYVGASGASYLLVNKLARRVSSVARWGSFTGSRSEYLAHFSKIDPFRAAQEEAECGRLLRLSDTLPDSVLRHDEWYNDYFRKGGCCDILGAKLYESTSHMVIVGVHRAVGDTLPFPRDAAALQQLMPALSSAARLHVGLIDIGYHSAVMRDRLDHLAAGVIFTDKDGRIVETNRAAERVLRLGDGLTIRDGKICARRNFETAKLTELIANGASASGGSPSAGCLLVGRDGGRPSYVVRVAPVIAGLAGYDLTMAMILVSTPDENRVSESELAELYGLSPAESRLAVAVAFGKRLNVLAGEFGLQITTLRTQLSSILKKCEVERQSDLVRLISNIPVVRLTPSETEHA
jgi:PAS domain-containing protein/DNA-binding CsgD family transcriptional regulator